MGAMPGSQAWHVYKRSLGPSLDTLFMQSNFGIVTKMGVWLMPYPECYMPLWLRVWNQDDLHALVETLRVLMLDKTIENVPQIWNTIAFASVMSSRSHWYEGDEPIPDSLIDKMAREMEVGRWMMRFALYGDEAVVEHKFRKVKEAFERISGAEVWGQKYAPEEFARSRTRTSASRRRPESRAQPDDRLVRRRGGRAHRLLARRAAHRAGRGRASRPDPRARRARGEARLRGSPHPHERSFIHVTMVIFDTKSEAEARRAYETSRLLVRECAKHGYGEYRGHLDFMDLASEQYSWRPRVQAPHRDDQGRGRPERDPLAREQGIWPKAMRSNGDGSPN